MFTASHASREGYRTPDLDGTDDHRPHLEPEGRDTKRGSPSWLTPSAAGGKYKSLLDFFKNRGRAPSESRSRKSETPKKRSIIENKHVRGTKAPGRAFRLAEPLRTRGKGAFVPFHFFPNRFSFSGVSISPAR